MKRRSLPLLVWLMLTVPSESKPVRAPTVPAEMARGSVFIGNDVLEIHFREAGIPFHINHQEQPGLRMVRLFVSQDQGKTWKLADERKPTEDRFRFRASQDGLFFFAIQSVRVNGTSAPVHLRDLVVDLKIYINVERRPLSRTTACE